MGTIYKLVKFEGSQGEGEFLTLFDSGATMSFIKRSIAQRLGLIDKLPRPIEFETADKNHKIVATERVSLDFYLDNDRLSDEFLVLPDEIMSEDAIVGAQTMQKWRLVIDMEKEDVYSTRRIKKHMLKLSFWKLSF